MPRSTENPTRSSSSLEAAASQAAGAERYPRLRAGRVAAAAVAWSLSRTSGPARNDVTLAKRNPRRASAKDAKPVLALADPRSMESALAASADDAGRYASQ